MRLFIYQSFFFSPNIKVIPFKIVPLGTYTPTEMLFPLLVAALEVFNRYGLQHVRYTVNKVFYKDILKRLSKRVIRVRPDTADKWMLHHDNAPSYTALSVTEFLPQKASLWFPSPPSPDFSPCDFSFFLNLKMSSKDIISGLQKVSKRV